MPDSWAALRSGIASPRASYASGTLPLARRGYRLLGVELGANLAAVARTKLADYTNARVLACSFEAWPVEQEAFDLVVSATAFHWVDPRVRYRKSAQALRPDGSLALIWNRADPEGGSEVFLEALEEVPVARHPSSLRSGGRCA